MTQDPEDGQSVGSVITYGKLRALDFGDMTWDIEHDLMCPNNPMGTVDMYFVSDHGINDNSTPEFVHAIRPRVAIMQNSARKGNAVDVAEGAAVVARASRTSGSSTGATRPARSGIAPASTLRTGPIRLKSRPR